jgi:Ca2+-binding RTX toxin-like protein
MLAETYLEGDQPLSRDELLAALRLGNNRPGFQPRGYVRFAESQVDELLGGYDVIHQVSDDPNKRLPGQSSVGRFYDNTGMSATLLRKRGTNEYTLAIRSTEYRNQSQGGDFLRDGLGGADGEIIGKGFAFAQIASLEEYYTWLKSSGRIVQAQDTKLTVTGYSLGGHLATVFTELHANEIEKTVVFNAAGRGGLAALAPLKPGVQLKTSTAIALYRAVLADPDAWSEYLTAVPTDDDSVALYDAAKASGSVSTFVPDGQVRSGYIYSDPRHRWASKVAGLLTVGMPLATGVLDAAANEKIVDVFGHATHDDAEGVASGGIRGITRQQVYIEDQPNISGLGGFFGLPGDYGNTHSLTLIADSLALMRTMISLDSMLSRPNSSDPTLAQRTMQAVLASGNNERASGGIGFDGLSEANSTEVILDALRRLFGVPARDANNVELAADQFDPRWKTPASRSEGGFGDIANRNIFHNNLRALDTAISALKTANPGATLSFVPLVPLAGFSPATGEPIANAQPLTTPDLVERAKRGGAEGTAYRYALANLNSFALVMEGATVAAYSSATLKRRAEAPDGMTDGYIEARAEMLYRSLYVSTHNEARYSGDPNVPPGTSMTLPGEVSSYEDRGSGIRINQSPTPANVQRVIFGDSRTDVIVGGANADRLFGGGGADFVAGGQGDDYIEGGIGRDVYTYAASMIPLIGGNDGADTIWDADGSGLLRYVLKDAVLSAAKSTVIGGAAIKSEVAAWQSAGGKFIFERHDLTDLRVTINGDAGGGITIRDFDFAKASQDGYLGIRLVDAADWPGFAPLPLPQTQGLPILGDRELLVQVGTVPALKISDNPPTWAPDLSGHPTWRLKRTIDVVAGPDGPISYTIEYHEADANGNLIRTTVPAPGMNDVLFDSPGNDSINAGGGNNTIYATRGGDDWIFAGDGNDTVNDSEGDNRIELGGGANTVFAGTGNDHIATGDASDAIADAGGSNRIEAGGGVDVISTGAGDDWVSGGAGDDSIADAGGTNLLEGGPGRDIVKGGSGSDFIEGGTDADILGGGGGDDQIWGDIGGGLLGVAQGIALGESAPSQSGQGDLLIGDEGDDFLIGSNRNDYLAGGSGRDVIAGGGGDDTIYGDDTIVAAAYDWSVMRTVDDSGPTAIYTVTRSSGFVGVSGVGAADTIYGGSGSDWIFAGGGDDHVEAGGGNDVVLGEAGSDVLVGGGGDDVLDGDSADANGDGTHGDDFLDGGAGQDVLFGGRGDDVLFGDAGDDQLLGDLGDDLLYGGPGTDVLQGGPGKDSYLYYRGDGVDVVIDPDITKDSEYLSSLLLGPEIRKDQVRFRLGSLIVDLGDGDALHFQGFDPEDPYGTQVLGAIQFADGEHMRFEDILAQGFVVDGTSGDDRLIGTSLNEHFDSREGDDVVEGRGGNDDIAGGEGADELYGGAGNDLLLGGTGNDALRGGAGDDVLDGGDGDDYLDGGAGNDTLGGGAGLDTYLLRGGMGADTVSDGESGETNVLLLGAGVVLQGLAAQRVEESLVLTLRGTSDSVTIADYYARTQSWTVRDVLGVETALDAVIAQPDPYGDDFIGRLWSDLKLGATARLVGRGYEVGWRALDQDTFETFQESAQLQHVSQTTTETTSRAEPPFDVLSRNTTVDTQETVVNFGQRPDSTFRWMLQSLEAARLESDNAVIAGSLGPQPLAQTAGQGVLTLRREGPVLGEQLAAWTDFGGVISYQAGSETVLANVQYDYALQSYRRIASVTDVDPGTGDWHLPVDTVAGDRVLVDMLRVENRHVGVLEIIGGGGGNVIYASAVASTFDTTLLVDAGAGDDVVLGGYLVYGNDGSDALRGGAFLIGGNGDDLLEGSWSARYVFTASESGIDTVLAPATSAGEYMDWYYDSIGITDWSERLNEGGRYAAYVLENGESRVLQYFGTAEEAAAAGGTDIRSVEPLDLFAPVLRRDDAVTLEAFAAAGGLSYDVAQFGPGVALEDLALTITVNGPASLAHPGSPWNAGGTLSVRWNGGEAGFDVDVPDVNYGFAGANLVLEAWQNYRVGEGLEAFEFADGAVHSLEALLVRATVVTDFGYRFLRGTGSQVIEPHWDGVDFAADIAPDEISAYREGGDLVLVLADGSAQATVPGWYADPFAFARWHLHFADGTLLDAAATTELGLTRRGTDGADVLVGDPEQPSRLFGLGGDDTLIGGAGDDYLDGGEDTDTYVFHAGSGADVVADAGPSLIVFGEGIHPWQVHAEIGSLVVNYGDGDSIRFTAFDADNPHATTVFERLEFADGTTVSYADFLAGGFYLNGTDGDDVITGTGAFDRISGLGGNDTLSGLDARDALYGGDGNDTLYAGDGNDDLYGGGGDDTLAGGPGDFDALFGEDGADTYVYAAGDGWDEIAEWDESPGEVDRLQLQGFAVGDVRVTRSPWNYYLAMGAGDRLSLAGMAMEAAAVVERIEFQGGTTWSPADLEAHVELLPGTEGEDILWGTDGADTIGGQGGYDELYGNAGDDFLAGGEGDDFYYFAAGDGHDTVDNFDADGGYDSIYFASAASTDAALSRSGTDLVITVGTDSVALAGWYIGTERRIDSIYFDADGAYWDAATIESLAPVGGNSAPVLANPLLDVAFEADSAFELAVPAGTFSDPDAGDALKLAATRYDGSPLPAWLAFDPVAALFTGNPALADIGISHILVTALDSAGASAQSDFALVVRVPAGMEATGTAGDDVIYGGTGDETLAAKGGNDYLYGDIGNDLLKGGGGNDVLQGGDGNDVLRGGKGQNVLDGGVGDDLIFGGQGSAFIAGGAGNDTLRVGSGNDVIAFNAGDGMDAIYGGRDGGNTLSFGGGIRYSDLALSRSGKDLVVSTGAGEGVTLKNWYAGNHSVLNLQIVLDATEDFDATSSDALYNRRVQTFDFLGMVGAFDAARAATPGLTSWEMTNALLAFHLSGADDLALGGDLAYWYGKNRSLQGVSLQSAQQVMGAANFGSEAQSLRPFSGLQEGFIKLA